MILLSLGRYAFAVEERYDLTDAGEARLDCCPGDRFKQAQVSTRGFESNVVGQERPRVSGRRNVVSVVNDHPSDEFLIEAFRLHSVDDTIVVCLAKPVARRIRRMNFI